MNKQLADGTYILRHYHYGDGEEITFIKENDIIKEVRRDEFSFESSVHPADAPILFVGKLEKVISKILYGENSTMTERIKEQHENAEHEVYGYFELYKKIF